MTTLNVAQVAAYAYQAGFRSGALQTAVAVAQAESGFRTDAVGDVNLTEPGEVSVGLWQINFRPSRDQPGGPRDPTLNRDPLHNAQAAFMISGSGKSFRPWSTYTAATYLKFMPNAAIGVAALQKTGVNVTTDPNVYPAIAPVVNLVPTPDGGGYWIICVDGEVFSFGNAQYHGRVEAPPKV